MTMMWPLTIEGKGLDLSAHLAEAPVEYIAKPIAAGGLSGNRYQALLDAITTRSHPSPWSHCGT